MPPWIVDETKHDRIKRELPIHGLLLLVIILACYWIGHLPFSLILVPPVLAFTLFRLTQYFSLIMTISELKLNIKYHEQKGDLKEWMGR